MPQIQLLDGKKIEFTKSINGFELVKKISKSLEKMALVMSVNGQLKDLSFEIKKDSKVKIITQKDKEEVEVLRHDAAHNGNGCSRTLSRYSSYYRAGNRKWFYYDFARKRPFTSEDLDKIEKKMTEIIDRDVKLKEKFGKEKKQLIILKR